jgi:enamine deaminase RidA (YjgF/YER057c/UK114 family)
MGRFYTWKRKIRRGSNMIGRRGKGPGRAIRKRKCDSEGEMRFHGQRPIRNIAASVNGGDNVPLSHRIRQRNRGDSQNMNAFANILEAIAHAPIQKRAITNHGVLNEAYEYAKPSSFSRGMRIDIGGLRILLISGTSSIDENGQSVHIGDFSAQLRRTFDNITGLLKSEGATWHDIVRTSCYLRDIDRDYDAFNEGRTAFFTEQSLDPLPASTGIQAHLCRPELLVEIEAIAMFRTDKKTESKE